MDGIFFYWISWIVWVSIMFFIPKTVPFRFDVLFHLLAIMVLFGYTLEFFSFTVHLSGIYLMLILCVYVRKQPLLKILELITGSFIVTLAYASFQLFSILDPIWLFLKAPYLLCIFLNYLALILFKNWKQRLFVLAVGMILGDLVYSSLLYSHSMPYETLADAWHDHAVIVLGGAALWRVIELIIRYFFSLSQARFLTKERKGNFFQ